MLQAGKELDHRVHDVIGLVNVKTYQRWLREEKAGKEPGRVGRPKMSQELRDLIIRMAKENVGWGVRKVLGELRKLKFKISRSTIRRVLVDEEILPDPNRHAPKGVVTPLRAFIAGHVETMVATDFFCKNILDAIWQEGGLCADLRPSGESASICVAGHLLPHRGMDAAAVTERVDVG